MKKMVLLIAMLVIVSIGGVANIAPIKEKSDPKQKSTNGWLEVRLDSSVTEARLIIPKSQLAQLRAELDMLENDSQNAATTLSGGISSSQTIVSGIFLSLAMVFGGILYARSTRGKGRHLIAASAVAVVGVAATLVFANVGPPSAADSISGKMFSPEMQRYGVGRGKIKLETGDGSRVILVVPHPRDEAKPASEE